MKKSSIFWIFLTALIFILLVNSLFHFVYFRNIHKNIRQISESEKEKAIEILNQSLDLKGYQINIGNVYPTNNKELVQVDLIKGNSKKHYLIDLKEGEIIRG